MSIDSFESGKKLGLTASLIAVISPILIVITYVVFFISLFTRVLVVNPSSPATSFTAVTIVYYAIGAASVAGVILFIVAMHRLSRYYSEPAIFKNALYGLIVNVVGAVVVTIFFAVMFGSLLRSIPQSSTTQTTSFTAVQAITPVPTLPPLSSFLGFFFGLIGLVLAALVIGIVGALFYMRALNKLGEKSGNQSFNTAGLLILIGVATTILLIGGIIYWVGWIFAASGFHSIKPLQTQQAQVFTAQQAVTPNVVQKLYCPYCGNENNANAIYCNTCGRKLQ